MSGLEKCEFFRTGKTSRGDHPVSWCAVANADLLCNGYTDGCPAPYNFEPAAKGPLRDKYPEPIRSARVVRTIIMLPVV